MKKSQLIAAVAIFASLAFTSCKKDYVCTCTTTVGGISTTQTHTLPNQTRVDANDACERMEAGSGGATKSCNL